VNKAIFWVKANLAMVICGIIIVIAPVVAFFVSSGMNAGVREELESRVSASSNTLQRGGTTNYSIPAAMPGGEETSKSGPLNEASLDVFEERISGLRQSSDQLYSSVLDKNAENRHAIIDGIFPEPASTQSEVKPIDFAEEYPRAHTALLGLVNAGSPPAPDIVQDALKDVQSTFVTSLGRAEEGLALSEEEQADLLQRLRQRRLELYLDQSQRLGMYATAEAFVFSLPAAGPEAKLSLSECYAWQESYWVRQDILEALAIANTDDRGRLEPVTEAPVKRLIQITVDPRVQARRGRDEEPLDTAATGIDPSQPIQLEFSRSLTGRAVESPLYDVRQAHVTLHVESNRLADTLKAIATSDLLAVTDVTLTKIDQWALLNEGYLYGQAHVVEAVIDLECLLLREWAVDFMPTVVKQQRGVPLPLPDDEFGEDG
jgi:hypothetical protein